MNDKHKCRCGSLEIQRLREENAVLMAAVEHYADKGQWGSVQFTGSDDWWDDCGYLGQGAAYALAQAAIEQAKGILDNDN